MRHTVDFLYSLYDALISINVPTDKARAVVDAMERDMATTLATKQDLQPLATREAVLLVKQDVQALEQRMESRFSLMAQQIVTLRNGMARDLEVLRNDMARDLEALRLSLVVRLGAMMFVAMGLLFTALKLT